MGQELTQKWCSVALLCLIVLWVQSELPPAIDLIVWQAQISRVTYFNKSFACRRFSIHVDIMTKFQVFILDPDHAHLCVKFSSIFLYL